MSTTACIVVFWIFYMLWRVLQANEQKSQEVLDRVASLPPSYRPELSIEIKATPVFKNKDRLWVGVNLTVTVSAAVPKDEVVEKITPLALEQIHLWALGFEKPDDALNPEAYAKLRALLLQITTSFALVKTATVIAGPRGGKFREALSVSQKIIQRCQNLDELRLAATEIQKLFPDLWADEEWGKVVQDLVDAETSRLKDPGSEFV